MRMEFDFGDGGGGAVARKEFKRRLPESFAFSRIVAADFNGRPVAPDAISTAIPLPNGGSHHFRIVLGGP